MKKIDASKSLIFGSKIEDMKNSLEYLNHECYFSNCEDFSDFEEGYLDIVEVADYRLSPYSYIKNGDRLVFSYFIPKSRVVFVEEEELKEKTLRPFKSYEEFFNVTGFKVGDVVQIKRFSDSIYETAMLTCIIASEKFHKIYVIFGASARSFDELFKHYKYFKDGDWLPFGVEE